jgi:hypothetical protein
MVLSNADVNRSNTPTTPNFTEELAPRRHPVRRLVLTEKSQRILAGGAQEMVRVGGPDARFAYEIVEYYGRSVKKALNKQQLDLIEQYSSGNLCALFLDNLGAPCSDAVPDRLPEIEVLENDAVTLSLAGRSQILLSALRQVAFAYDIDNNGKLVRLVANFKGGGREKLKDEVEHTKIGLSSHHGISLEPHTEAPYYSTTKSYSGHSPAPSSLILTARWNPLAEPTSVIPVMPLLDQLGANHVLALALPVFGFTRSESFTSGKDAPRHVSIIDIDPVGRLAVRFNVYRAFAEKDAPKIAVTALSRLRNLASQAQAYRVSLSNSSAIVINNQIALHSRDVVADNRRLLIRLFGYGHGVDANVLSHDPLVVKG